MTRDCADHLTSPDSDAELLILFQDEPDRAWQVFVDRYADLIFTQLRSLGFDYDQAMDRFVYVFEKLAEEDFRRLRGVRYLGNSGELTPWVRKVVRNLSINWAWSEEGRKRLLKGIARLPEREQRVFELYFWRGLAPSAIHEQLRLEKGEDISFTDVLDALEQVFSQLSEKKLWRLLSNLARTRGTVSLDEITEETGSAFEPAAALANPEEVLIQKESAERLSRALAYLSARERSVVQFRYEDGLGSKEVAEMLHLKEPEAKRLLKMALAHLRQAYEKRVAAVP